MHWSTLTPTDQIFTHFDEGLERTFAATALRRYCETLGIGIIKATIPINEKHAELFKRVRGIEPPRLRRAMRTKHYLPLLHCHMPDGTHLMIDGSHTYIAMHAKGITTARSYIAPQHIWERFLVEGLPPAGSEEALLKSYSGIKV